MDELPKGPVCLDTSIIIWGIQQQASKGQEDKVKKAKKLLTHLSVNKIRVFIPAIVLSEFLVKIPHEKHGEVLDKIQKSFPILPFDTSSAIHLARIWQKNTEDGTVEKAKKEDQYIRTVMKTDFQIIASAVNMGVTCIYSEDSHMEKYAVGEVEVRKIPEIYTQGEFF